MQPGNLLHHMLIMRTSLCLDMFSLMLTDVTHDPDDKSRLHWVCLHVHFRCACTKRHTKSLANRKGKHKVHCQALLRRHLRVTCTMPFLGTLNEVNASSNLAVSVPRGLDRKLMAQVTSGTGPRSLCQAYTADRAAATAATQPHVTAAMTVVFAARTARRSGGVTDAGLARGINQGI